MATTYIKPLNDRTIEEKDRARAADVKTHASLKKLLKELPNKQCADCTARMPGWAALPHGIFICINCAQIHRHIGRHISQVKAINTGTYLWYPDEYAAMKEVGNKRAEAIFCGKGAPVKPSEDASRADKEAYIRNKYEHKRWYTEPQDVPAQVHENAAASDAAATSASAGGVRARARAEAKAAPSMFAKTSKYATKATVPAQSAHPDLIELLDMDLGQLTSMASAATRPSKAADASAVNISCKPAPRTTEEFCPTGTLIEF